jgi:hypothetical protein
MSGTRVLAVNRMNQNALFSNSPLIDSFPHLERHLLPEQLRVRKQRNSAS